MGKRAPAFACVLLGVMGSVAACGADRPPTTSEELTPTAAPDASAGGAFSTSSSTPTTAAEETCTGVPACTDGCCAFQPFYCDSLGSDASFGTFYPFGAGTPAYRADTTEFYSKPASLALTNDAGGAAAMRFESMTTLSPGHPVQISFSFFVDGDAIPPELARFEFGPYTLQMQIVGDQIELFSHKPASPWSAPFTDSPAASQFSPFHPQKWNLIAFDVGSDSDVPLSIVFGSTIPTPSASVLHFDDLELTHLPCNGASNTDAGTPVDAGPVVDPPK